ncbi:hypothetical protein BU16DRAFT_573306 [Lophium mytilinum]|uniref:Gylcosyl hydrolase 115 C-terminal domain-containing protein n=1 Tax=Lophium mytilinum TaxID=390894 RepID=A0A6A6QQ83_9PEZI|nr:hypothetical protein BU16DRAFT_573306 [Lophium mytilinum]
MKLSSVVLSALLSLLILFQPVSSLGQKLTIAFDDAPGRLKLATRSTSVQLLLDAADWPGVLRVADDLAVDFGRVTAVNGSVSVTHGSHTLSSNASLIFNVTRKTGWEIEGNSTRPRGGTILAGTVGKSAIIDDLVEQGKINVTDIVGRWEAFKSQIVKNPVHGASEALVISGSDKRGTIYGLYDISEQIGVSPWYYWADVAPKFHEAIFAMDVSKTQGSPSIKYRGIFLNDEAPALTGFINAKYPPGKYGPGYNADFYSTVFELLLRLRANYMWPAQWNSMLFVDDPRTQPLADEYGIVMGTSHTEPMARATKEWNVFGGGLQWQWNINNASIRPFMKEGAIRAKPYENVITMGMRGSGDTAMTAGIETAMLEDIVENQRGILAKVYGNASAVPQMWCLYKEVQGYYEAGMRVPDDITLLWTEDNWGNIRRLPIGNETDRSGGAGVYYHFDYVGDPRDYKWINTIQLQKTAEQMHQAYMREAKTLWIVNVGDLKPLEIPINHFLDLAYDLERWGAVDTVSSWLEHWATREFGSSFAQVIAEVVNQYGFLAARRKYELIEPNTFSLINYQEADKILAEWEDLGQKAQAISDKLPLESKPAFFEMVLHPVFAGGNFNDIQISAARNQLYANQGRNSANSLVQRVLDKMKVDHEMTVLYNTLLDGKWNHMMDQTHLGYQGYWQAPMRQATPALQYVQNLERALSGDMGVSVESSNATVPGDDRYHTNGGGNLEFPPVNPFSPERYMEIFSIGTSVFTWIIQAPPYVKLSQSSGKLSPDFNNSDTRVWVSIDWNTIPSMSGVIVMNITSSTDYGTQYSMPTVSLTYNKTSIPSTFSGFVEDNSIISIEAEHYTSLTPASNLTYTTLPGYGRTLSAITLSNPLAPSLTTATAPMLEYNFYTFTSTTSAKAANLTLIFGAGLNTTPARPLAYIAQIDDLEPQRRAYIIDQPAGAWPIGWYDAVAQAAWKNTTSWGALDEGEHKLKIWLVEPGVVLQKIVLDLGGVLPSYLGPPESLIVG